MKRKLCLVTLTCIALAGSTPALAQHSRGAGGPAGQGGGMVGGAMNMPGAGFGDTMRDQARVDSQASERASEQARLRANENSALNTDATTSLSTRATTGVSRRTSARDRAQGALHASTRAHTQANINSEVQATPKTP